MKQRQWHPYVVITLLILLFISVPYLINYLVLHNSIPFSSSISGNNDLERTWLVFWASYVGCVLSSVVTFIVLYLTLRQNDKENKKNRIDAHHENSLIRESQERALSYQRASHYVTEIRNSSVAMYHSVNNSKAEDIYSCISLEDLDAIDFKMIRTRLLEIQDDSNRAYVEMEMLLSYGAGRDEETEKCMKMIKKLSNESYDCIRDLIWFFIECKHSLSVNQDIIRSEVYKYASEHSDRIEIPDYQFIWSIIIENDLMDLKKNRFEIVSKWHDEWHKINQLLLLSLRGLVNHYYKKAQEIK